MDKRQLRIISPINLPDEVDPLIEAGADELYCGFLPPEWIDRFSLAIPINRRDTGPGNIKSFKDLRRIIGKAKLSTVPVYLTLNAQMYTQTQVDFLKDYCLKMAEEAGIDGFLVSDPGMIHLITTWIPSTRIHVSSLAACHNSMTVKFFGKLGVQRIILPRQVTPEEVFTMYKKNPEMELEVFIINDGCILEEGHCSTIHGAGPFCLTDWHYHFQSIGNRNHVSNQDKNLLESNQRDYRQWTLCQEASGAIITSSGYPVGPCGLCSIHAFRQAGVSALKVVGREAPTAKKVASIQITRMVRDMVLGGASEQETIVYTLELKKASAACKHGCYCYYPQTIRQYRRYLIVKKNSNKKTA